MQVDITTDIVIDRPRTEVARYTANPDHAPRWYVNIKSVEWETPPPYALGTRIAFVAQFLGRRLAYSYECTELIPEERLVMRTAEGPFPMETTYEGEAEGNDRTRMTLRNRGTPSGFGTLMAPIMTLAIRRANRKDLQLLKQILEAS